MGNNNKQNAERFVSATSSFRVADGFFEDEEAIDRYLDGRDADPFDSNWTAADTRLKGLLATAQADVDRAWIEKLQEQGRRQVHLAVMRQTGHPDLAAYASDDVDLVIGFLAVGDEDAFVHSLRTAYESGTFPSDD
ncbi:hypothetical protein [Labrys neptuniae]